VPLLIATANPAKAREFRQMLAGGGGTDGDRRESFAGEIVDLSAFPNAVAPEETGQTFLQNACIKAVGYARQCRVDWTLADDSGLEVDALAGAPGVYSARWAARSALLPPTAPPNADADNNATLLKQLADVPEDRRSARFVCVLALADAKAQVIATVRGTIEGKILRAPRGSNGFGYDPLFFVPDLGKTTAELPPAEKHRISHRGRALAALSDLIAERGWSDLLGIAPLAPRSAGVFPTLVPLHSTEFHREGGVRVEPSRYDMQSPMDRPIAEQARRLHGDW
jgi:XTP/dITP diphosphohydrolase